MKKHRILSLILALATCASLAAPASAESATASVIQLTKTEGTVKVSKSSGKNVSLRSKLRLYKGYHVATEKESYAWINLDDVKLIKEDASSEVEVRKSGKKLEVNVSAGNVFFDVSEKLDDDESLNISTSTMVVGIRGTSGWIEIENRWKSRLYVLEGSVQCHVADPVTGQLKAEEVKGGEMVECVVYPQEQSGDKCDIIRQEYKINDIPGYVLVDLVQDVPLCGKILDETGMDILRTLAQRAGGRPDGKAGDSATREVIREADKQLERDESQTDVKLDKINEELRRQDNKVDTDSVWDGDKTPPPNTNKPSGNSGNWNWGGGGSSDRPTPPATKTYAVTFSLDGEGATWPDGTTGPITLTTGANGRLTSRPPTPVRAGYEFGGWYVVSRVSRAAPTAISLDSYVFSADTRLGVIWLAASPAERFTVTFDANGGTVSPATAQTAADGTVTLPTPAREGFTFNGWFTAATGGTAVTAATKFTQNTTIYAQWTEASTEGVQWEYIAATKTLRIWGNGKMEDIENYSSLSLPWDAHKSNIETVMIENGVTNIGDNAFDNCSNLVNVSIPNSVTDIRNYAFMGCSSLPSVTIPNGVTGIFPLAFSGCSSLTSVTIPDSVTGVGSYTFQGCTSLTSITIPNSVTVLGMYVFSGCDSLTDIYFGGIRAEWNALNCNSVPSGCTVHCTDDGDTPTEGVQWEYNEATKTLLFFGTGPMEDYSWDVPRPWDAHKADITNVVIDHGVTSIGNDAFSDCNGLTSVTITEGVTRIGINAFVGCNGLTNITIPNSVTSIEAAAFSGCYSLASVTIPNSVTYLGSHAFDSCQSLTNVTIPASVTNIDENPFAGCNNLIALEVDANNPNYCSLNGVLFDKSMTTLIGCPGAYPNADYNIPSTVHVLGGSAFDGCGNLTSIIIPNSVTSIGDRAFQGCESLTSITIPSSVTSIGEWEFSGCNDLASIEVDTNNPNYCSQDGILFNKSMTTLLKCPEGYPNTSYSIPSTVTVIGVNSLSQCEHLTSVTIPDGVTNIDTYAFFNSFRLSNITIPSSVTNIGDNAFGICGDLTDVYYTGTEEQWNAITIDSNNEDLTGATIHYNSTGPATP